MPKQMNGMTKDSLMQVPGHSGRGSGLAVVVVVVAVVVVVGRGVVPTRRFGGAGREGLNDLKAFSVQDFTYFEKYPEINRVRIRIS